MSATTLTGGNGIRLYVDTAGDPSAQSILFIHGFSQCSMTWHRQMDSQLARTFRLAALDLRGHGRSEKPANGYDDSRLWAEDIHAVIQSLELDRPVLVGWSYGGFVIGDYLRFYGDHDIAGINLVGAATKISQGTAPSVLGADFLALLPGFFSLNVNESVDALRDFVRLCVHREPSQEDAFLALGYNACVPPAVRQGLLTRTIDNDDLLPKVGVPVLISHGERDRVVHTKIAREHAKLIPGARLSIYENAGHAVFADDPDRFNHELLEFVREASSRVTRTMPA